MKNIFIFSAFLFALTACTQKVWEKTSDGVVIRTSGKLENGAKSIAIKVISDQIIHVVASPTNQFSTEKSLCVVDQVAGQANFEVAESGDSIVLSTAKVIAKISKVSGDVAFYDESNRRLLQERPNGKSFSPISVEGTSGYSFSDVFKSTEDEAFY
jgi:alpha-D-xyloside xylohydrolase